MLLALAIPQPAAFGEDIHAVNNGRNIFIIVSSPQAKYIVLLVNENLPVKRFENLRRADIEDEKTAGADEEIEPAENFPQGQKLLI